VNGAAIRKAARASDLVHVHGDMATALTLGLTAGRPTVWTTHGLSFLRRSSGVPHAVFVPRLRRVLTRTRMTICTTAAERDELLAVAGDAAPRLRVVPNGIDLPAAPSPELRARVRAGLGIADDEVVALFAGRLDDDKGARDAVQAVREARAAGAPLTLLVAGEGPLEAELRGLAGPAVRLLGFRDDVMDLLGAADIFVLPSRREGSSYAVIEALGSGLAVVVCDGLGNPETVGDAGVVVPCGDVPALARTLADLAADPARRAALGEAGRARVASELGRERFLSDVAAIYREAAGA
jgi:glycosyltransferase involved in cell wall biosynthesis